MPKEKRYITICDTKDSAGIEIPEGSSFVVIGETKRLWKGIWSGMCFTMHVSVPKKDCAIHKEAIEFDEHMKKIKKAIRKKHE
jgi:hypothetical protein